MRPQSATSIPAGGSKMHFLNKKKQKTFLSSYLFIPLFFDYLSLGRDVPVEFGAKQEKAKDFFVFLSFYPSVF
ncbi:hypothetical protein ERL64_03950 [Hafnia alvei]|nr:hypothetical protein ERL64_03950 [Hafnia alvei]